MTPWCELSSCKTRILTSSRHYVSATKLDGSARTVRRRSSRARLSARDMFQRNLLRSMLSAAPMAIARKSSRHSSRKSLRAWFSASPVSSPPRCATTGSDLTDAATAVDELREGQIGRAEPQPGAGSHQVGPGQQARGARHGNVVKGLGRREVDRVLLLRAVRAAGHEEMCRVQSLQSFHHRPQFDRRAVPPGRMRIRLTA